MWNSNQELQLSSVRKICCHMSFFIFARSYDNAAEPFELFHCLNIDCTGMLSSLESARTSNDLPCLYLCVLYLIVSRATLHSIKACLQSQSSLPLRAK